MNLDAKAKRIRAVVLDIDGVLTDGRVGYGSMPGEIKFFDVRDGHAIKLLQRAGLRVGVLSGRASEANRQRTTELGLNFVLEGEKNKGEAFTRLLQQEGLQGEECLTVGDDVVDIPMMKRSGVAVAVADAVPEVAAVADWQTKAGGGRGAVREVAVWLLKIQGHWDTLMARYLAPEGPV